ncbi:MAG TPA: HD domain-containing protein [Candidatus Saccharicenans sp.]|jgi:putative nucleotidyltransferase with HDIG domain|nr:HD domain-containing protein [Candidatus Saccharicenans sp.]HRD01599.1 HD domain-containing protein [Candidatus Saccharicenans sp.]
MAMKSSVKKKPVRKYQAQQSEFLRALDRRYPGIADKIRQAIEKSEREFSGSEHEDSFLWEHSLHVAHLAWKIARAEKKDSTLAGLAALFHDAGKFQGGLYHQDNLPEEEASVRVAADILKAAGIKEKDRQRLKDIIINLHLEGAAADPLTDIIHDADFLAKFGLVGVANFFIKTTLRGRNLHGAIMNHLSKEMTYAAALPLNMRTEAGRELAMKKSTESLDFYKNLLQELKDIHGLSYEIKKRQVALPSDRQKRSAAKIGAFLVMPRKCDRCGGKWEIKQSLEKGVKCRQAVFHLTCQQCGNAYQINFCLPGLP